MVIVAGVRETCVTHFSRASGSFHHFMSDKHRLGVYMHSHTFNLARSAYLADIDTLPDGPDSLVAWIDVAIAYHAGRTTSERAALEREL